MADKLVLVHTVPVLLEVFNRLGQEILPGIQLLHVLDEPLLDRIRRRGCLAAEDAQRLQTHVNMAQEIEARAVLVTCSTVSPSVDEVSAPANLPVLKIDAAMIAEAVRRGTRIGVVATSATTLEPTQQLLQAQAKAVGRTIEIELVLVENALPALLNGDATTHDNLVKKAVLDLAQRTDVVVLAQASMARVLAAIVPAECPTPVLSSPHLALQQIRQLLTTN